MLDTTRPETELAEQYPIRVVCRWIGNSRPVAARHYLQLTDEHIGKAIGDAEPAGTQASGAQAAQNAAQKAHESGRRKGEGVKAGKRKTPVNAGV